MRVALCYGTGDLEIDIPGADVSILAPRLVEGLADEAGAFTEAVRNPIGAPPLRDIIGSGDRVAVVVPDITRPLPSDRLLQWLLAELPHVPDGNWTVIIGTGSHRGCTETELESMLGREVTRRCRVVNHNAHDPSRLLLAGRSPEGEPVLLCREYVEADRRIVLGFIEPHLMAGFSGGYKAVFPGVAGIDSIMHYHRASVVGDPRSTWGLLDGNPTQDQIRANGSLLPVDFCVNVTLNRFRHITAFFCGDVLAAHRVGCGFAKETSMVACARPFPIVVTTNSGYPLDQNLYQTVKGMSAAAQIVEPGGFILTVARCNEGFPAHGNFRTLITEYGPPERVLDTIMAPRFCMYDQWEAQLLAIILLKARVGLYSEMDARDVERAHLEPVEDIGHRLRAELAARTTDAAIAVLPEGPMTIPYLA